MYTANILDIAGKLLDAKGQDGIKALLQEGKSDEATEDLLRVVDCAIYHGTLTAPEGMALYSYLGPSTERQVEFPQPSTQLRFAF